VMATIQPRMNRQQCILPHLPRGVKLTNTNFILYP